MKYLIVVNVTSQFAFEGEGNLEAAKERVRQLRTGIISEADNEISSHRQLPIRPTLFAGEGNDWVMVSDD